MDVMGRTCPSTGSAARMKVKWTTLGMVVFLLLSVVMTCCFVWQYRIPKLRTGSLLTPPQRLLWNYAWRTPVVSGAAGGLHTDGNSGSGISSGG